MEKVREAGYENLESCKHNFTGDFGRGSEDQNADINMASKGNTHEVSFRDEDSLEIEPEAILVMSW